MSKTADTPDSDTDDDTAAERLAVRKRAMDLLARREHACTELAGKLKKRGHASDDIDAVLADLTAEDLLSDARYAEALVASRASRGTGPVRIRAELQAAGVSEADIRAALDAAEVDWLDVAEAARRKRFGADIADDYPSRAKQMRFLQRRGFDMDQIAAVCGN
ncbi:regulatory protein RecX [Salinisphaera sp. USBA-960]|uniref:regulatory protein RecX n=1 Tax=Salinisphaera orenii TaxID=856731 RepID=UPI000DBE7973|nr:regulatory protein RecX [Salifodinibacter halophilus]NNC25711.1 regulatory protein RecX [Salifodinibacter halophilus]